MQNVANSYVIPAASVAQLQQTLTARFELGQPAFVSDPNINQTYILQNAIGTANNREIINTIDDSTRQWVAQSIGSQNIHLFEADVDLTVVGTTILIPPMPGYLFLQVTSQQFINKITTGNISTNPTTSAGNNATNDNVMSSSALPSIARFALGVNGISGGLPVNGTAVMVDLASPVLFAVTVAATGTNGFDWVIRMVIAGAIL